jgi:ATP phosphoribosyltransferase regulatory subunit
VALFSAFIESLSLPEALAARLKRVAWAPAPAQRRTARAGEAPVAEDSGQLAAMLSGLSSSEAATLLEEVWALAGVEPVGGRGAGEIAARLVRRAEAAGAPALTPLQAAAIGDFMAISTGPAEGPGADPRHRREGSRHRARARQLAGVPVRPPGRHPG